MQTPSKYSREQKIDLLIKLESGAISEVELLLQYGISTEELERWRKGNPLGDTLSAYSGHKSSRFGDLFLIIVVLDIAIMYGLHKYDNQALSDRLVIPLTLVFCISVLGLIYQDVERGFVKIGRYRRKIRRTERPYVFWSIIAFETLSMLAFAGAIVIAVQYP